MSFLATLDANAWQIQCSVKSSRVKFNMYTAAHFSFLDYIFFAIVFISSLCIGVYYAILARNKVTTIEDYLLGNRRMKLIPISLSLVATTVAGYNILGIVTEIYAYGTHIWILLIFSVVRIFVVQYIFLPILYELKAISGFQYFELRFDRNVKRFASLVYIVVGFIFVPLTVYVPSIALQNVTGLNLYAIAAIIMSLCVCYTAVGGIKAVVWTDVFQLILMLTAAVAVLCVGLYGVGGFANTWKALERGDRLILFKTDFDLEARGTIWGYLFSLMIASVYNVGIGQSCLQRYNSLPSLQKVKYSLWIHLLLTIFIMALQLGIGGVIYATYEDCDPLTAGQMDKIDQILPFFVQSRASLFPGFNGIFIASIFSAGISLTSTYLNTMSGTIYNDFLAKNLKNISERSAANIVRAIVVAIGILGILCLFAIERMGTVFRISFQFTGITAVTIFGLYLLGMFFPKANSKGAKYGSIISMVVMLILTIGNVSMIDDAFLPLRTDGCSSNETLRSKFPDEYSTLDQTLDTPSESIPWIFRINFQYHTLIGIFLNIFIGYIVSVLTGGTRVQDERLLVTFLRLEVRQDPLLQEAEAKVEQSQL